MRLAAPVLAALLICPTIGQAQPGERFQLRIPEVSDRPVMGGRIELARRTVAALEIDISSSLANDLKTDRVYTFVNGQAAATVAELRRSQHGFTVVIDLDKREDLQLRPGANSVEITAENRRRRRFYRNWVIELERESQHDWFTFEYEAARGEENPAFPDVGVSSPRVPPTAPGRGTSLKIKLKATVTAHDSIAAVTVQGLPQDVPAETSEWVIDRSVTVHQGDREVVVEARDAAGNTTRVGIPLVPPRREPPPRLSGKAYLVAIGVSAVDQGTTDLFPVRARAASDARRLGDVLAEVGLVSRDRQLVLTDRDATLTRVRSALRDFSAAAGADDLLILYLAGYGLHGSGRYADRVYLATSDTRTDQLGSTALDLTELGRLLDDPDRIRARNVLLLFDVAEAGGPSLSLRGNNLVNSRLLHLASPEKGRAVLVSAEVGQRTTTSVSDDRSDFVEALLEGLAGDADENRDRIVSVSELARFAAGRVSGSTQGAQTPEYRLAGVSAGVLRISN